MTGLLNSDQAADLLNVPKSWIMKQARAGTIPHVRLGHYVRFDAEELTRWAREQACGPRAEAA